VVLVIDTSSARSALALVRDGRAVAEDVAEAGRDHHLARRVQALIDPSRLSAVAIALGPGSFTGLRVGVSYGLGLAMGLGIRLLGLDSLQVQTERASEPATGLVEAGRGRVYWRDSGTGELRVGEPGELPRERPVAGWLRGATEGALLEAGIRLLEEAELRGFAETTALLLEAAPELGYDSVRLQYMQSFAPVRGQHGPAP
jgi:tRNA threonylcarbamoyl adenosine modification protein YeaZ